MCDTLTNSYPILHFLLFICLPKVYDLYNLPVTDPAGIAVLIGFFLICTCGCVSQVSTAMLAVTRFLCIVNPFAKVSSPIVMGYIKVYTVIMTGLNLATMFCKILPAPNGLGPSLSRICLILNVSQCLIGIFASLFTVLKVTFRRRLTEIPDKRLRSSVTILLMNLPYVISVALILVTLTGISGVKFALLTFPTVACFTSMLNPVTILLLNHRARQYTKQTLIRKGHTVLSLVFDLKPLESSIFSTAEHQRLGEKADTHLLTTVQTDKSSVTKNTEQPVGRPFSDVGD